MEQQEIEKIIDGITTLDDAKALIRVLLEERKQLLLRIDALEREVAQLKKNSSNSSKPPSSDIVKPKEEQRHKGIRKIGGQKGHEGLKHKLLPSEKIDQVVSLELTECRECGAKLEEQRDGAPIIQQVYELVEKPVRVVQYERHGHFCPCCQKVKYKDLPEGVIENHPYGIKLQSIIGYMKGVIGASYRDISEFCSNVFKCEIPESSICNIVVRTSEALKTSYQELEQQIPKENVLNIDESGWKCKGESMWVWVFCTQTIAFFTLSTTRGSKVLYDILGENFKGGIISDFYSAYVKYANVMQQYCLAHLIRDIKYLTTLPDKPTRDFGNTILKRFRLIFLLWHQRATYDPEKFAKRADRIQRKLYMYLISTSIPPGDALRLKKRIEKHWDSLFRFLKHPSTYEPTNNLAERTLRSLVRIRKMTQGTRGSNGNIWIQRSCSVVETCRKQKRNIFDFFTDSLKAFYFDGNYPSLLNRQ